MSSGSGPIFVAGLSGSGKTQLRVALSAHPELSITRRTYLWNRFFGRFGDLDNDENLNRCLHTLATDPHVRQLDPDVDELRRDLDSGRRTYARLFGFLHAHHAAREGKRRWGDQLAFVERFADPITAEFPDARIVHMVRDPRLQLKHSSSTRQGAIGWQTARWLHSAELARRNTERYPGNYLVVRYEDLASDRNATLAAACEFIGEEILDPMRAALADVRLEEAAQESSPSGQALFVDRYVREELDLLGYDTTASRSNDRPGLTFWLNEWLVNRSAMAGWRATQRRSLERQVERC